MVLRSGINRTHFCQHIKHILKLRKINLKFNVGIAKKIPAQKKLEVKSLLKLSDTDSEPQ